MMNFLLKSNGYLIISACIGLSACGEFSYKRGAGAAELQQTKQACQAKYQEESAMEKCLAENGWVVRDFEKEEPLMAVSFVDNNRMVDQGKSATEEPAHASTQGESGTNDAKANDAQDTKPQNSQPNSKPKDPLDIFLVNSWWSIGKGPDALKIDTEECVAKLGEEHRPDSVTLRTTRGFLICMRTKNWRALQAK
ncbi:MAG: hypothetical protein CVU35_08215 [Betaproteobacteria bacterium HGW-Betaproteobacteria-8]|nr:MAG: hypothetical protein CVU35_08215 [Betaproteobacteria bacterium HGW-Betaproteobacteria-8]